MYNMRRMRRMRVFRVGLLEVCSGVLSLAACAHFQLRCGATRLRPLSALQVLGHSLKDFN